MHNTYYERQGLSPFNSKYPFLDLQKLKSVIKDTNQTIDILLEDYLQDYNRKITQGRQITPIQAGLMTHLYRRLYVAAVAHTLQFRLPYIVFWFQKSTGLSRMDNFAQLFKLAVQ